MLNRFKDEKLSDRIIGSSGGDYYDELNNVDDDSFDAIIDVESLYCNSFDKSREIIKKSFDKLKIGGVMFSLTFADGTYGLDSENIDYHALLPSFGPMSGKGYTRYTTKKDIEKLYKLDNNEVRNIERQELHLNNGEVIKEWIIELKKV